MNAEVILFNVSAPGTIQSQPAVTDVTMRASLDESNAMLSQQLLQVHLPLVFLSFSVFCRKGSSTCSAIANRVEVRCSISFAQQTVLMNQKRPTLPKSNTHLVPPNVDRPNMEYIPVVGREMRRELLEIRNATTILAAAKAKL